MDSGKRPEGVGQLGMRCSEAPSLPFVRPRRYTVARLPSPPYSSSLECAVGRLIWRWALARFELRRLSGKDAPAFRQVRLQALLDHPEAFGASWEDERQLSEARFAERLDNGHVIGGFDEDAVLVGTVGLFLAGGAKRQHIASVW